jgi:acyl-CoA synthetase (AMP-forming)/AMP-acid ligase II
LWRNTLNAAEPVMPETMRAFVEAFAPCGFSTTTFSPGYGLAEATLKVSAEACGNASYTRHFSDGALERHCVVPVDADAADARELVGCGPTMFETTVVIVDPETRCRLPLDRVGEIWVSGPSRALGYWKRPEESREAFEARIVGEAGREEPEPYLRTGDFGFVHDGQVFITGRCKDLIIVRGSNHYPQDLEWTAQKSHPALRPGGGAAFSVPSADGERVVMVHEVREAGLDALTLREAVEALCAAVAREHEVTVDAVQLVLPGGVPKTSSGKKQRRACRDGFLEGTRSAVYEWRSPRLGGTAPQATGTNVDELLAWLRSYAETRINSCASRSRRSTAAARSPSTASIR